MNKKITHNFTVPAVALFFLVLGAVAVQAAQMPPRIVIHEFSQIEGQEISLGDIATIEAKPHISEILKGVSLGRAPKPGEIKHLARNRVVSQLRLNQSLSRDIEILSPERIYVKRAFQEISDKAIRRQVEALLSHQFEGREFRVKRLDIQEIGHFPKGHLEMRPSSTRVADKHGNLNLSLEVLVDGRQEDTIRIRGEVAVYETVACAARTLPKGSALVKEDVILRKMDIFLLRGAVVRTLDRLEGQRLKRTIAKDTPVRADWLEPLPLIRKGEVVALVAKARHLKIVTSGIAREDGFKGRVVKVENLSSGKLVRGLARAHSTVEVIY